MDIDRFMQGYREAWLARDPSAFAALFHADGHYHNTPFAVQRGHAELAAYWERIRLQEDIHLAYDVLARRDGGGIAHWRVDYRIASEELFAVWARSAGTPMPPRRPGDPLPRMTLDGVLDADFEQGLCRRCRLWWHSVATPA